MDISYQEIYSMNKEEARRLVIETYHGTGNLSLTACLWRTSRHVVRKWVRRYRQEGHSGLKEQSRRPKVSPCRISCDIKEKVVQARKRTGYGRKRLSWYLSREEGIILSPHTLTLRHVLNRNGFRGSQTFVNRKHN